MHEPASRRGGGIPQKNACRITTPEPQGMQPIAKPAIANPSLLRKGRGLAKPTSKGMGRTENGMRQENPFSMRKIRPA